MKSGRLEESMKQVNVAALTVSSERREQSRWVSALRPWKLQVGRQEVQEVENQKLDKVEG